MMLPQLLVMFLLLTRGCEPQGSLEPPPMREALLQQAFGEKSDEVRRPIRLLVRDKGLLITASEFSVDHDGQAKFTNCSVALVTRNLGQSPGNGFMTLHSEWLRVEVDAPVESPSDIGNHKIISLVFPGGMRMKVSAP
jgi:hypothetical protein